LYAMLTLKSAQALCGTVVRPAASRIMAKIMRKKHSGMKLKFCRLYPIGLNVS
jgi:hypothetical protein